MVVFFMVAATSNSAHFRLIHLPSSLSILDVHLCPFTRFFSLSRGRVNFLSWERIFLSSLTRHRYKIKRCKTSIFRIYFKFILNVKIRRQSIFQAVNIEKNSTQLRSYAVTQFHLSSSKFHPQTISYIILYIYYNIYII